MASMNRMNDYRKQNLTIFFQTNLKNHTKFHGNPFSGRRDISLNEKSQPNSGARGKVSCDKVMRIYSLGNTSVWRYVIGKVTLLTISLKSGAFILW